MVGESNQKRSSGRDRNVKISNSRAMGVIVLIALLFVFQVVTFVWHKVQGARMADEVSEVAGGGTGGSGVGGAVVGEVAGVAGVGGGASGVRGGAGVGAGTAGGDASASGAGGRFVRGMRFAFDPNTITGDSLQLLGFTARQAQSILKYRSKGGRFRYREDFARLYVVDSAVYTALEGYLLLPRRGSGTKGALDVPGVVKKGNAGTNGAKNVPGVAKSGTVGTKIAQNVPCPEGNAIWGTDKVQNVPRQSGLQRREPGSADFSGREPGNSVLLGKETESTDLSGNKIGNKDSSGRRGSIYGKKVEKNRFMCNLNTADSAALVKLYGIGGYYAKKILRYREALGGSFVDVRQLLEIEGFTQERFAGIEKNIFVNGSDVKGFSVLNADRKLLEQHPYIGPYAARGIVTYLKLKGKEYFKGELHLLEELVKERVITAENADKLRGYLLPL